MNFYELILYILKIMFWSKRLIKYDSQRSFESNYHLSRDNIEIFPSNFIKTSR